MPPHLEHDRKKFLTVVGNAAIGNVIAVPTGYRIVGIEFRELIAET